MGKTQTGRNERADARPMRLSIAVVVFIMCVTGCATRDEVRAVRPSTLAGDPRFPARDIEGMFTPAQWRKLRDLEYVACVRLEAQIRADGSVSLDKVLEIFPDASWFELARGYLGAVELRAASVGSRLSPRAEIYVVFFKRALDGNLALIFARQKEEPGPGMERRAMYVHTRRY